MNNRFIRGIKSGAIESIEKLKVEFKAIAKMTHPDLAGPGANAEDFIRARSEYESALRDFGRHRFGFSGASGAAGKRGALDRRVFYANLAILFKRGFPKSPRHEKESRKYSYYKYLVMDQLRAWPDPRGLAFEGFEAELLEMRRSDSRRYGAALDLVLAVLEYHAGGPPLARTAIEVAFKPWKESNGSGAAADFLGLLVGDLACGQALV